MTRQQARELIQAIPKTEIHVHLEAMATADTIWQLIVRHKLAIPGISSKPDLERKFKVRSLDEFVDLFINVIQSCFQSPEDLDLVLRDARDYLKRNNILYAEIFIAPSKLIMNGLSFQIIIAKLDHAMDWMKQQDGIDVRFIIDVSRSYGVENARKNLELTLAHRGRSVIGIGLGGSEASGPAKDYKDIFARAVDNGLRVVAHAGEDIGPESIWDAINILKVSRIGHGISAIQDKKLMDYLAEKRIPLEICPTSNLFTGRYVTKLADHPIRPFFDRGLKVTVNTDDPSIFGVELVDEYANLTDGGFFKMEEIVTLISNGVFSTFLPAREKAQLWSKIAPLLAEHSLEPARTV
ncbi:MAG: adenosine deaminase [Spirochaetia bacterium]